MSDATNLVPGDRNGRRDIFVRDRQSGTTRRVSVDSNSVESNGDSYGCSISADGRFVAFDSVASNLVPSDTNGSRDVFVRDLQSGVTTRVSVDSSGAEGNSGSGGPSISADGRYVAFGSESTNLVPGDSNGRGDVFVRDVVGGVTVRASVDSSGVEANHVSGSPCISADGRCVAFMSYAWNLVPGDTNGTYDIFVRDLQAGVTVRASVDSSGVQGNGPSYGPPSISGDGRYVAFPSYATNLVPYDVNEAVQDIFLRDLQAGVTTLVSVNYWNSDADNASRDPSISADGRYVAFLSLATDLVPVDTNGALDVFVRDLQSGSTTLASINSDGEQGDSDSGHGGIYFEPPSISADGRYVAFWSFATNLVPRDTNGVADVFVHEREGGPSFTSLCDPGSGGVQVCPCSNPPSAAGRGCDNSSATGGAILSARGATDLSSDSLVFATSGETPDALSLLLQGTSMDPNGRIYGQGIRCVGGSLERLFSKTASGGGITAPDFSAGDPQVSVHSASKGDVIQPGQSRWYLVCYRDPIVLGGCAASSTFNATQTGRIDWSP